MALPQLSKPLESWLIAEPSDDKAVETIAKSDLLRSEAAMLLPALRQAALRPATHAEIKQIIGARFATYPQPERDDGEWVAFWADYFDALAGLPAAVVEAGMAAHVRAAESEFLPKPGKLAALARSAPTEGRWFRAHARARKAVEMSQRLTAPARPPLDMRPSAEEVSAMMADFHAKMAEKVPPRPVVKRPPTPQARVDERGISDDARRQLRARFGYAHVAPPRDDLQQTDAAA